MIISQSGDGSWSAFERGPLRPIVAEGVTRTHARDKALEMLQAQIGQEYAYAESMSSRALEGMPGGEDFG